MTPQNSVQEYLDKRDFSKTPEPAGTSAEPSDRPVFVIHKHDASNLHYDFRLEVQGVLKSWAIPKGPSTDPSEKRLALPTEESRQPQVICSNTATLVYLANQACITPHVWLSRRDKLYYPDRMVFDLDPPDGDIGPVRSAARAMRKALDANGLKSFVMTTGSRGLHVVVPLAREVEFDEVRKAARRLAEQVAGEAPDRLTVEMAKVDRQGRLFLDYLRNSYGQTTVAPYAVRAKPGAPVATPLDWDELDDTGLNSQSYTMQNIFRRLGQKDDPWRDMREQAQSLHGLL
jgi:bifunctional non-homologous end joining protein LigD